MENKRTHFGFTFSEGITSPRQETLSLSDTKLQALLEERFGIQSVRTSLPFASTHES